MGQESHKLPELWKLIAGALGRSGERDWRATWSEQARIVLYKSRGLLTTATGPSIPRSSLRRRVSMCRRLKYHGRDRLTFSVLGADEYHHQETSPQYSIMFGKLSQRRQIQIRDLFRHGRRRIKHMRGLDPGCRPAI